MDGFPFVHRETVRFRDVDSMGHVNNAVYLTYLEQARIAFLRHLGVLEGAVPFAMILARIEVDFRSQASPGEELEIGVRASRFGTKSFDLDHEIRSGDRVVVQATSVLVGYDYASGRSVAIPDTWRSKLAA